MTRILGKKDIVKRSTEQKIKKSINAIRSVDASVVRRDSVKIDSSLPIIRTRPHLTIDKIRLLIYGQPKIGKTTLCSGFPDVLILATEKGYEAHNVYVKDIVSWEQFKDITLNIVEGKHNFKTIAVDTIDLLFKLCTEYICDDLGIAHVSDEDWGKGYSMVNTEFEKWLNKLFLTDYGIIMISHTQLKELTTFNGKSSKIMPSLPNQARKVIIPKVSVIGLLKMKTFKTEENQFTEKRVLSFKQSSIEEAGDRDGVFPDEVVLSKNPHKNYEVFKTFYAAKGGDKQNK